MSIDAAIGRVQQILTMQQDLLNPASLMSSAAAGADAGATTAGTGTTSGTGASFAAALASAQDTAGATALTGTDSLTGTDGLLGTTGLTGTTSLTGTPPAVETMLQKADSLVGRPYVWGGGHSTSNWLDAPGYDCSGFVSAVLGSAGIVSGPQTTQTLPSQPDLANGPGQYVTIYDRDASADPGQDHVIIDIGGQWFESGGNSADNPSGGVAKISQPSQAYLSTFNQLLHPLGL